MLKRFLTVITIGVLIVFVPYFLGKYDPIGILAYGYISAKSNQWVYGILYLLLISATLFYVGVVLFLGKELIKWTYNYIKG